MKGFVIWPGVGSMAEAEEVGQSCKAQPEPINNDEVPIKEIEIDSQNHKEDKVEEDEKDEETGEETEDDEDEQQKKLLHSSVNASNGCGNEVHVEVSPEKKSDENMDSPIDAVEKSINVQEGNIVHNVVDGGLPAPEASLKSESGVNQQPLVNDKKGSVREDTEEDNDVKLDVYDAVSHQSVDETIPRTHVVAAPNTHSSPLEEHMKEEEVKNVAEIEEQPVDNESRDPSNYSIFDTDTTGGGESGTEDEQAAFLIELDKFHKEKNMDFKPPRFYKGPLNLLKLWRSVLKLGGYDKVTACKYWRQVGESFNPPKTCTTVSWTFRMFYEKALLDYERHRASTDGSGIVASFPAPMGAEYQAPGAGRARRDAAARAMQGWHSQRVLDNGEVSDPIIKDKNSVPLSKKEKPLKSLSGVLKRKNPSSPDTAAKAALTKVPRVQSESTVIDIGSPADWVKINVRATKDCYEVYALVPGLLREEVRVQSDPAGRLVISGEPENPDNPWNVTPFKKVVSLPSRIDPHQTSAVVTLHGQLFVRVPFEQYD